MGCFTASRVKPADDADGAAGGRAVRCQTCTSSSIASPCLPSLHTHFACDQQGWKQPADLGLGLVQPSAPSLLLQQPETFTKAIPSSALLQAHRAAPARPWHLSPTHSKGLLFPWATQRKQDDLQPQQSLLAAVGPPSLHTGQHLQTHQDSNPEAVQSSEGTQRGGVGQGWLQPAWAPWTVWRSEGAAGGGACAGTVFVTEGVCVPVTASQPDSENLLPFQRQHTNFPQILIE